jgi:hypothetical protein
VPLIQLRWRRLNLPEGYVEELPVEVTNPDDPGQTFRGRARVRSMLQKTDPKVALVDADGEASDPLQLVCELEAQLLNLWNEDNTEVDDIEGFDVPQIVPLVWRIDMFASDPGPLSSTGAFYTTLTAFLLAPLYRPVTDATKVSEIEGVSLCTRGLIIIRGNAS